MMLITVEASFSPPDTATAIALVAEQVPDMRAMKGCLHYAVYGAPGGDGIAILQRWETTGDFAAYRECGAFATLGQALRPLMTAPPVTLIAKVDTPE